MKFLNVKVADMSGRRVKVNVKVPLFIITTAGRLAPELIYGNIFNKSFSRGADKAALKQTMSAIIDLIKAAADNDNLAMYNGLIADIENGGEKILISIS